MPDEKLTKEQADAAKYFSKIFIGNIGNTQEEAKDYLKKIATISPELIQLCYEPNSDRELTSGFTIIHEHFLNIDVKIVSLKNYINAYRPDTLFEIARLDANGFKVDELSVKDSLTSHPGLKGKDNEITPEVASAVNQFFTRAFEGATGLNFQNAAKTVGHCIDQILDPITNKAKQSPEIAENTKLAVVKLMEISNVPPHSATKTNMYKLVNDKLKKTPLEFQQDVNSTYIARRGFRTAMDKLSESIGKGSVENRVAALENVVVAYNGLSQQSQSELLLETMTRNETGFGAGQSRGVPGHIIGKATKDLAKKDVNHQILQDALGIVHDNQVAIKQNHADDLTQEVRLKKDGTTKTDQSKSHDLQHYIKGAIEKSHHASTGSKGQIQPLEWPQVKKAEASSNKTVQLSDEVKSLADKLTPSAAEVGQQAQDLSQNGPGQVNSTGMGLH